MPSTITNPLPATTCLVSYSLRDGLGNNLVIGTVVGILPESFQPRYINAEVWMPLRHYPGYSRDRARTPVSVICMPAFNVSWRKP